MERIPFPEKYKGIMKDSVKFVWIVCPECGVEWECTERRKEALTKLPQGFICIKCFEAKRRN
jgi:hypothetical protein